MTSDLMERPTTPTAAEVQQPDPSLGSRTPAAPAAVPVKQLLRWLDDGGAVHPDYV